MANTYNISIHRKPAKPRSADRQATTSTTAAGGSSEAYDPEGGSTAAPRALNAEHAATADTATTADKAKTADNAKWAETSYRAESAAEADHALSATTADRAKTLQTDNYQAGLQGGKIDSDGNADLQSLNVRGAMQVLELIVNRLSAMEGDTVLTESGVIERIEQPNGKLRLFLRSRWEGDRHAFQRGDVLRGIYNNTAAAANHTDTNGQAITTSWLRVTSVGDGFVDVESYADSDTPDAKNYAPLVGMRLARWGNVSNKSRQSSIYLSATQGAIYQLAGVTKPKLDRSNYATTWGKLPDFVRAALGGAVAVDDSYLYARGVVVEDLLRLNKQSGQLEPFKGEKGDKGDRGNDGNDGRDGARGSDGRNGRDGRDGEKGKDGKNGKDGLTPMPNLLIDAHLPSNTSAWGKNNNDNIAQQLFYGGDARHEPSITPPITGAEVWCCYAAPAPTAQENTWQSYGEIYQQVDVIKGKTYTLSVYAKGAESGWLIGWPQGDHFALVAAKPIAGEDVPQGWQRFAVTFTATKTEKTNIYLRSWYHPNYKRSGRVYFSAPKLEESFAPTPWTRAQADFRGPAVRNLGEWEALPSTHIFESGKQGESFIDLVSTTEGEGVYYWQCKQRHQKSERPSKASALWELGTTLNFVATKILLAEDALVERLTVRRVESRNAAQEVVFSATDSGDVYIGGKATIAGFTCNVPVTINPDNYTKYLERRDGDKLYFSPFDIGTSIIFHGDFRRAVGYNVEIYISNRGPKLPVHGTVLVTSNDFPKVLGAQMAYLGTSVFVTNAMRNRYGPEDNIHIESRRDDVIGYSTTTRLDYQLPMTSAKQPQNFGSIWQPTQLKPLP